MYDSTTGNQSWAIGLFMMKKPRGILHLAMFDYQPATNKQISKHWRYNDWLSSIPDVPQAI